MSMFKKNPQKTMFFAGLVLVFFITIFGVSYNLSRNNGIIAIINGEKITKQQYDEVLPKYKGFYEYSNNEKALASLEDNVKEKMIEDKIILTEAKKRGITASDEEIEKKYQALVSNYKDEDEYLNTVGSTYGWTAELTKDTMRIQILKEKLLPEVMKDIDVSFVYTRYDTDANDAQAKAKIDQLYAEYKSGKTIETIGEELSTDPLWKHPNGRIGGRYNITEANEKRYFERREDWRGIKTLKKEGDTTNIIKSGGGYYVFYVAKRVGKGTFNTWQEFLDSVYNTDKLSILDSASELIYRNSNKAYANYAEPRCSDWTPHKAAIGGWVRDASTGLSLPPEDDPTATDNAGVNGVSITADRNWTYDPVSIPPSIFISCTPDSFSATTTTGGFGFGGLGTEGEYFIGGTLRPEDYVPEMNCTVMWSLSYTKQGYRYFYGVDHNKSSGVIEINASNLATFLDAYDVGNGQVEWLDIYLIPNSIPVPTPVSPVNNEMIGTGGVGLNSQVNFVAKGIDANSTDKVAVNVMYKKDTETNWHHFGTTNPIQNGTWGTALYNIPTPGTTALSTPITYNSTAVNGSPVASKPATINANGWNKVTSDGVPIEVQGTEITYPAVTLSPGNYTWAVRAFDQWSNSFSTWAESNFTINDSGPTLSCNVTPEAGLAPLVVKVTAQADGFPGQVTYDYDMDYTMSLINNWEYLNRSTPVYYTYGEKGNYTVRIRAKGGGIEKDAICTPTPITVSPPTSGGGGEVAP